MTVADLLRYRVFDCNNLNISHYRIYNGGNLCKSGKDKSVFKSKDISGLLDEYKGFVFGNKSILMFESNKYFDLFMESSDECILRNDERYVVV